IIFNAPTRPNRLHHLLQRGSRRSKDEVISLLRCVIDTPTHEQPVFSVVFPPMQDGDACPIEEPWAFGPITHRESLPIVVIKQERFNLANLTIRGSGVRLDANRLITSHGEHMEVSMIGEPGTQFQVVSID